jgi:hypothetical protein
MSNLRLREGPSDGSGRTSPPWDRPIGAGRAGPSRGSRSIGQGKDRALATEERERSLISSPRREAGRSRDLLERRCVL